MPVAIPIALAIAGGASAGASVYGAKKQAGASNKAAEIQGRSNDQALQFERERDAYQRQQYEQERTRQWTLENEDRVRGEQDRQRRMAEEDARRGRMAPFQQFGAGGASALAGMLSVPGQQPMPQAPMQSAGYGQTPAASASQPVANTMPIPSPGQPAPPNYRLSSMLMPQQSTVRTPRLRY